LCPSSFKLLQPKRKLPNPPVYFRVLHWFDYLLPGLETLKLPIPLGGTSNHFRTERLLELGGWDPFNVTEDDLGIRASKRGYTVGLLIPLLMKKPTVS